MSKETSDPIRAVQHLNELMDSNADHFKLLGVGRDASPSQVRNAYFSLAKLVHPDVPAYRGQPELQQKAGQAFKAITEAHKTIANPQSRRSYLAQLALSGGPTADGGGGELSENQARVAMSRAKLLLARRAWAEAETQLRPAVDALELDTDHGREARIMLARAIFNADGDRSSTRLSEVRSLLEQVTDGEPGDDLEAQGLYHLAVYYRIQGEPRRSLRLLKRATELNPNHIEAQRELRLLERRRKSGSFEAVPAGGDTSRRKRNTGKTSAANKSFLDKLFGR